MNAGARRGDHEVATATIIWTAAGSLNENMRKRQGCEVERRCLAWPSGPLWGASDLSRGTGDLSRGPGDLSLGPRAPSRGTSGLPAVRAAWQRVGAI
jgi:hypothetical protein